MFKESITLTLPFSEEIKRRTTLSFQEINNYDNTLYMSAIILFYSRVKDIKLSSRIYACPGIRALADAPWTLAGNKNEYCFNWFPTTRETLEKVDDYFSDGQALKQIEDFVLKTLKQNVKIRTYPENNTVCIITEKLSVELYHYLISFMSLYFPIFKENPLNDKEISFMRTLTLKSTGNFLNMLNEMANEKSFREFIMKVQLENIEKKFYEVKIRNAKRRVEDYNSEAENYLRRYKEIIPKLEEAKYLLCGIESAAAEAGERKELEEYLINNKSLINISVNGNYIDFIVKTYLVPYLTETWKNIDRRGAIYQDYNNYSKRDVKLLLNAIFSEDHCLKLRMCAYFHMNYFGGECNSQQHYDYVKANSELKDYIPNEHFNKYNCFGQNESDILEHLRLGDVVSAIECCISAAKKINIDESMTFSPFVVHLFESTGKCLVTEDGAEMTVKEAIEYLKEQKNETN